MDSILESVKKQLGIMPDYTHFDEDLIMSINTTFLSLTQIGAGPESGYRITDSGNDWSEFTNDNVLLEAVKTYMYLKVKFIFDPPQSSTLADAMHRVIDETEWRINQVVDGYRSLIEVSQNE